MTVSRLHTHLQALHKGLLSLCSTNCPWQWLHKLLRLAALLTYILSFAVSLQLLYTLIDVALAWGRAPCCAYCSCCSSSSGAYCTDLFRHTNDRDVSPTKEELVSALVYSVTGRTRANGRLKHERITCLSALPCCKHRHSTLIAGMEVPERIALQLIATWSENGFKFELGSTADCLKHCR